MKRPFAKIFAALNEAKIKYLVVGGVAVNLHGYLRFTGDLDILLLLNAQNLKKMGETMKKLGYTEMLPVSIMSLQDHAQVHKWLSEKNMRAFAFSPPADTLLTLDIIVEESLNFGKIIKNRVVRRFDGVSIPVVSIDYLIKMKKRAGRSKDLEDLKALIKLKDI